MQMHPDAKRNIDQKSADIVKFVKELNMNVSNKRYGYTPDLHINAEITPSDIIGAVNMTTEENGAIIARSFSCDGKQYSLEREGCQLLSRLADDFLRNKDFKDKVDVKFAENVVFEWLKNNYKNEKRENLSEYFITKCVEEVKHMEIWIPVNGLHTEVDFEIGKITFRTITKNMLDEWLNPQMKNIPEDLKKEISNQKRKKVQGYSAAVIECDATPNKAFELAYEKSEEALAFLRVFSPCNLSPDYICYCLPLGKEAIETYRVFHGQNGKLTREVSGLLDRSSRPWVLNRSEIEELKKDGLDTLGKVLSLEERSNFQDSVMNALLLYSKSCLMKTPSDKLVYILVALESLLLKNDNEPIMQNIAERVAFVTRETAQERRDVVKLVKEIYGLRSRFIHHGRNIENINRLREFMVEVYIFFISLSLDINKYSTKEEFVNAIEEMKFS